MKKLRVFAGPNGSGKTTLTSIIREKFKMGVYVNADELKVSIREKSKLFFSDFRIEVQKTSFLEALGSTSFDTSDNAGRLEISGK